MAAVGLTAMGLLAAACGGGGGGPGVAGAGGITPTTPASSASGGASSGLSPKREAELLKFSQCMQSEGITDFPDPTSSGLQINASAGGDLNPRSPQFQAAQNACKKYMPGGNLTLGQQSAAALKYAECMRSHGLPDFPDPNGQGAIITSGQGDLDPRSPQFQAAQSACANLAGPFKMQFGTGVSPGGGSGTGSFSGSPNAR